MATTTVKSGKLTFDFSLGASPKAVPREPDAPLHIVIMGDFSGQQAQSGQKSVRIDCDNFDQVMAGLKARCRIPLGGKTADFSLSSLDDFHPDRLLPTIDPLLDPATVTSAGRESNTDLIGRLMGDPPPAPAPTPKQKVDIASLLKSAVASSVVTPSPAEDASRAATDLNRTNALRAVLHDRNFQTLEANWRALDLLVRNFGGEEEVCLSLLDCGFQQFVSELTAQDDLQTTPFLQLLRRRSSDQRFAVVLALYTFEPTLPHMDVLARAAKICSAQQTTFIASANSEFVGCKSFAHGIECNPLAAETQAAWEKVRALPEASRIALALPRFLARQPYGAASEPIETFAFEELAPDLPHEHFLWANPAALCGHVVAEAFLAESWAAAPTVADVDEMPVYRFKANGESKVKPCAETWIPESVAERIYAQGLIPILSIKGRDAVRVGGLRTVATGDARLALQ
jgi:predicted component of type VI protein secretion system